MPTNDHDLNQHEHHVRDADSPGYETTDVNVNGVAVFLAGLFGSVLVFFIFCFVMGRVINNALTQADGAVSKWNAAAGEATGGKRQDLASNPEMQQKELNKLTTSFPEPRLDIDDGNQSTADLHAREDLLLDHYSRSPEEGNAIRIPIDRAMELIAQRGLPVYERPASTAVQMFGVVKPEVRVPLTTGFARTGFELSVIEAREQKMSYGKATEAAHAELTPTK
ncbi:MAG TPA: hypothetical protein VK578_17555 [Edaphobacter sp.]|nr:hypothetical protein [Edaphobacter sp.]